MPALPFPHFIGICAVVLLTAPQTSLAAAEAELAAAALRYGNLTVEHWLMVDTLQQIERAIFYQPATENPETKDLQQSMSKTETQLEQARYLYKQIYKKQTPNTVAELDALLDGIAAAEAENEKRATALLTAVGSAAAGTAFRAKPVTREEIAPAWEAKKLIGENFQPKRIIFGSTGQAGDARTLPLQFDFGQANLGPYVSMDAPGGLAVAEKVTQQTDPVYPWMQKHHTGYHYWAGVYNNQNTYVAPWFLQQYGNDDDVWMRLADGTIPKRGEWGQVNIWNMHVQDYLKNYCEAQGRTFKNDRFLVCYDYTAEPHPFGAQPPGRPQYAGYNESAIAAFRDALEDRFRTIENLNASWETTYRHFSAIQPPSDPYVSPREKASPLSYEFARFHFDSHTRLWKACYDAFRKGDPAKPIVANASMFMSGWPVEALDAYAMQKAGVADWIDMHMNNFWPNLPEQIYLYSLCRLTGRVPVQFEYVWTFPRLGPVDDNSEADFRNICTASVWRNLVWGKKVFVFFDFYYDWPAYHNAFLDRDLDYSILRPSACVVPTMKRKALRFNDLFLNTEIATPSIIVLQPTTSILNSPPIHPNQGFSYHSAVAGHGVHDLLFPRNYPFLYVPEEAVLEDGYDLGRHKVIILPQAPYLPTAMSDKLLEWIKAGGTLIAFGLPGIWDPYGRDDNRLVTTVFGKSEINEVKPGTWQWTWKLLEKRAKTLPISDGDKFGGAVAPLGQGTVLVSTDNYTQPQLQKLFYETLDKAIGKKPFSCDGDTFELVLRANETGRRYLCVLNPHTRDVREGHITVAGEFRAVDMGIGSGIPVPCSVKNNETQFKLRLHPGEATAIALN